MKRTKWEILKEREAKAYREFEKLRRQLTCLERTPFQDGNQSCSTCGALLPTEADFAKHYLVDDWRYLNLGNCPTRYNNDVLMPSLHNQWGKGAWEEAHELNETKDKLKAEGTPITLSDYNKFGGHGGFFGGSAGLL